MRAMLYVLAVLALPVPQDESQGDKGPEPMYRLARSLASASQRADALATLERAFQAGLERPERALLEPDFVDLRPGRAFRELLREHLRGAQLRLTAETEEGEPLVVRGRVVAPEGDAPLAGARIYVYHTDWKGSYGPGGSDLPRIFGYLRTDEEGRFELRTIRPASYPESDVPQHVHYTLEAEGRRSVTSEVVFADDPKLRGEILEEARREGVTIAEPERDEEGVARCEVLLRAGSEVD